MSKFDVYVDGVKQPLQITWDDIKFERSVDLKATDLLMISDYPISQNVKDNVTLYRQILRDLPQNYSTPEEAAENYPDRPEGA